MSKPLIEIIINLIKCNNLKKKNPSYVVSFTTFFWTRSSLKHGTTLLIKRKHGFIPEAVPILGSRAVAKC